MSVYTTTTDDDGFLKPYCVLPAVQELDWAAGAGDHLTGHIVEPGFTQRAARRESLSIQLGPIHGITKTTPQFISVTTTPRKFSEMGTFNFPIMHRVKTESLPGAPRACDPLGYLLRRVSGH